MCVVYVVLRQYEEKAETDTLTDDSMPGKSWEGMRQHREVGRT